MDIREVKTKIEDNTITNDPLIFLYSDCKFICYQYIDTICKNKGLTKLNISSLSEMTSDDDFFGDGTSSYLYVYDVDKLTENVTEDNKNLIVITKSVPKNLSIDYTEIPKLVAWQVEDYMKMRLPGLAELQIKWLCEIAKFDPFRLNNEADKLAIFPPASQGVVFDELNQENAYCDLNNLTIFNFTNAVMKKNLVTIHDVLADLKYIDIEGTGLITIFHNQFKHVIDIQLNPRSTAASLGMNPKQYNAIRYGCCGKYTPSQLINIYDFITSLDARLKNGEFQFKLDNRENNAKFIVYITMHIIELGMK